MRIDPRNDAARRDLADVRLADRVFAPHYAAPVDYVLAAPAPLLESRGTDAAPLAQLDTGDRFEVLELSAGIAWGRAPALGLVGYVAADRLKPLS
ncbi:SH3 domain-containing protein [Sphingomonas turrisvirgatae]|uniref:SH3 domain-containing protein n=1 Tax=Sphingomonas turrisvirgatae TaxID=1888892 RepID=UPI00269F61C1